MQIHWFNLVLIILTPVAMLGCSRARYENSVNYQANYDQPVEVSKLAQKKHQRAISALEVGDLAKAEALCKEVLILDRRFGAAHNTLGTVYFQQGQSYQAAWEFEHARRKLPNRPEPHNNLGMVFERTQRYGNALFHYQQAVNIEPQNSEFLGNLVRLKIKQGDQSSIVRQELQALLEIENRPEWAKWCRDRLALGKFYEYCDPLFLDVEELPHSGSEPDPHGGVLFQDRATSPEAKRVTPSYRISDAVDGNEEVMPIPEGVLD